MSQHESSDRGRGRSLYLPLLLLAGSWFLWTGFQTTQLLRETRSLRELHGQQEPTLANAQKMRAQLDAIAAGTRRLADAGNPNARLILDQLAANGVTINPGSPP